MRGFTILELMVSIALASALMLLGIPGFSAWLQGAQIRTAAEGLQNGLQLARSQAVQRNTTVNFQLMSTLTNTCALSGTSLNWVVSLDSAVGLCASSPSADLATPTAPRIVQVRPVGDGSKNAVMTAKLNGAAFNGLVAFNGLGRVTPTPAGNITYDVSNPTGGTCLAAGGKMRCLRVEVSASGQIRMCDPNLAANSASSPDPQGC